MNERMINIFSSVSSFVPGKGFKLIYRTILNDFFVPTMSEDLSKTIESGNLEHLNSIIHLDKTAITSENNNYDTPLILAVIHEKYDIVKLLINDGADVNSANFIGMTPLHYAAEKSNVRIAKLLLEKSAKVNSQNDQGETPLFLATIYGYPEMVELLIDAGADVNIKDEYGNTPLHWASEIGEIETVELLLHKDNIQKDIKNGMIKSSPNSHRTLTPVHFLLTLQDRPQHRNILLDEKFTTYCDAEERGSGNYTPLHLAVLRNNIEVVKLLIKKGADPLIQDKFHMNTIELARREGHFDIAHVLEKQKQLLQEELIERSHKRSYGTDSEKSNKRQRVGVTLASANSSVLNPFEEEQNAAIQFDIPANHEELSQGKLEKKESAEQPIYTTFFASSSQTTTPFSNESTILLNELQSPENNYF